jgi:1-phosphatidylinositol-3-phosphate 5-kinase
VPVRRLCGFEDCSHAHLCFVFIRCIKWEAHGGKSGSDFCKMMDDRFILKQVR